MPTATHEPTTPTRRSAMFSLAAMAAGLTMPALAVGAADQPANLPLDTGPDTELLAACAEFRQCGERLAWINGYADLTQDDCDAELDHWYVLLDRIGAMTPRTSEGWRAKLAVAERALTSTAPRSGDPLETEEQFALDTLRGWLEGMA